MLQQDGARLVGPQVKYHVRLVLENKKYFSIEKFLILTVHTYKNNLSVFAQLNKSRLFIG